MSGDPITGKEAAEIGLATMAVPADRLEEQVTLVAKRLAMVPAELLFLNKYANNRAMETMGMRTAMESAGKLHDYSHTFDSAREFGKISREQGLNAALAWRNDWASSSTMSASGRRYGASIRGQSNLGKRATLLGSVLVSDSV